MDGALAGGEMDGALAGGEPLRCRLRDGFGRWRDVELRISDQRADLDGLVVHLRDVGEQLRLERSLDHAAATDPLTGIANRSRLLAAAAQLHGLRTGCLIALDVHRFASVNDLYGSEAGDTVLMEIAQRLQGAARPGDVVCRLGGDGFAMLTDASSLRAYALATRLVTALQAPYELPGHRVLLSARAGVAELAGAASADEALHQAGLACDRARQLGRGRVEYFDRSLSDALVRRALIEQALPGLTGRGELAVGYRPVLELSAGTPVGVESSLRWHHPRLGPLEPAEFLPVAEALGLAGEVEEWLLRQACRPLSRWVHEGRDLWLAVDVSAGRLGEDGFGDLVVAILEAYRLDPRRLLIQVDGARAGPPAADLAALSALGVRIALNHFGTGPASLAQLRGLPVDVLKVGPAVYREPPGVQGPAGPIMETVVRLAQQLGLDVVAVGLADEVDSMAVAAAGCRLGQGDGVARPMHAEHLEAFLEQYRAPRR
jgi:diguanylate cyclase (GGDEF)-like protein